MSFKGIDTPWYGQGRKSLEEMVADPEKTVEKISKIWDVVLAVRSGALSLTAFSVQEQELLNKALHSVGEVAEMIETRSARMSEQKRADDILKLTVPVFLATQKFETEEEIVETVRRFAEFNHVPFEMEVGSMEDCESINPGISGHVLHVCTIGNKPKTEYAVVCEDGVLKLFVRILADGSGSPQMYWFPYKDRIGKR